MLNDTARLKMMADKLNLEVFHGRINDKWAEDFIFKVRCNLYEGYTLTEKQITKLEELFERY